MSFYEDNFGNKYTIKVDMPLKQRNQTISFFLVACEGENTDKTT